MNTVIAIAATTLAILAAGQASAQTDAPMKASVSYADLDLSRPTGREALERRIDQAVSKVCADEPSVLELKQTSLYRKCREEAWVGAKQQLAAVYSGARFAQAAITVGPGKH
ncbi:UrcA family protein [Phenylobacterium sp.]|jgi:UrcA family protein|uniref:UrcA family protein n=1 Tax=Phenylobacterium sp. TaxID=1871053 RepID=UPI002E3571D2|nr:UrcA family protein [Phenylobacterium sp.]HEX3365233.1 UrcA family protein [Phenylobacterium sp.]